MTRIDAKTHPGTKLWDCENSRRVERVQWVDFGAKTYATVDDPARVDPMTAEVLRRVHTARRLEFIEPRRLILLNPTDRQFRAWARGETP